MLCRLIFELGHTAQFPKLGVAAQDPAQLRMLGNMTLDKQHALLRVQTTGHILGQLRQRAAAQIGGILPHGNGVHIHDAIKTLIFILQSHPVLDGAHIGAKR